MDTTISFRTAPTVAAGHNRRDEFTKNEKHIDQDGIYEIWKDKDIQQVYNNLFSESVNIYNKKQKRNDRKITDYYQNVVDDERGRVNKSLEKKVLRLKEQGKSIDDIKIQGKHPSYEIIIGIGSSAYDRDLDGIALYDDDGVTQSQLIDEALGKAIMKEYVDTWAERNPQLELYGVYYHADEVGSPHIHCDFVPHAEGYKQGLSKQSSIGKALDMQGFGVTDDMQVQHNQFKINNPNEYVPQLNNYTLWQDSERRVLEDICKSHGFTNINHPTKDKKSKINYILPSDYRELMAFNDELADIRADIKNEFMYYMETKDANIKLSDKIEIKQEYYDNLVDVVKYKENELDDIENKEKISHINKTIHDECTLIYQEVKKSQNIDIIEFMKSKKYKSGKSVYDEYEDEQKKKIESKVIETVVPLQNEINIITERMKKNTAYTESQNKDNGLDY